MAAGAVVEVPYTRLTPEALRSLVEEFVTRDTTDYGRCEKGLEEKMADVMHQLESGEAAIMFDPQAQTAHIVPVRQRNPDRRPTPPGTSPPAPRSDADRSRGR
jgi:uncharacterized protein YheU (UPF0270 family)